MMSSKHLRGDINYAWPTAEVAVMGAKVSLILGIAFVGFPRTVLAGVSVEGCMQQFRIRTALVKEQQAAS